LYYLSSKSALGAFKNKLDSYEPNLKQKKALMLFVSVENLITRVKIKIFIYLRKQAQIAKDANLNKKNK
jgi:hypothetical protein